MGTGTYFPKYSACRDWRLWGRGLETPLWRLWGQVSVPRPAAACSLSPLGTGGRRGHFVPFWARPWRRGFRTETAGYTATQHSMHEGAAPPAALQLRVRNSSAA